MLLALLQRTHRPLLMLPLLLPQQTLLQSRLPRMPSRLLRIRLPLLQRLRSSMLLRLTSRRLLPMLLPVRFLPRSSQRL